jgi:hypothetical protein
MNVFPLHEEAIADPQNSGRPTERAMVTPIEWQHSDVLAFAQFFTSPEKCERALDYAVDYCHRYDDLLRSIWSQVAPDNPRIAVCDFGSPARYEMLGESDLDCMLIRDDTVEIAPYRDRFIAALKGYGFSKLDVPVWGSLDDCRSYLRSAITEGNQVIEARFVCGDLEAWQQVNALRDEYSTRDRFRVTFAFQYLYFNQYYKQRTRPDQCNLKYGHGGTRDFLFPVWLANFREGYTYVLRKTAPAVLRGLQSLLERGDIAPAEHAQMTRAIHTIAIMRNELLRRSMGTPDSGLTYLSKETAEELTRLQPQLYPDAKSVLRTGHEAIAAIRSLKEICHQAFMRDNDVRERIGPGVTPDPTEELAATVLSWSVNLREADPHLVNTLGKFPSWAVLTSLACNPTCPEPLLQELAERGTAQGYEYVTKVVGRNPNTTTETLQFIVNSGIEHRFREPAIVRLEKGWRKANELQ